MSTVRVAGDERSEIVESANQAFSEYWEREARHLSGTTLSAIVSRMSWFAGAAWGARRSERAVLSSPPRPPHGAVWRLAEVLESMRMRPKGRAGSKDGGPRWAR